MANHFADAEGVSEDEIVAMIGDAITRHAGFGGALAADRWRTG